VHADLTVVYGHGKSAACHISESVMLKSHVDQSSQPLTVVIAHAKIGELVAQLE